MDIQTELSGTVENVIFSNEENGYTVITLVSDDGEESVCMGCLPGAVPGEYMSLNGNWVNHPSYGRQFKVESSQRSIPDTAEAAYDFLSSRIISGVGPATASLLVSKFGAQTLSVIENEPERLCTIKGFSMAKAKSISEEMKKLMSMRRLIEYLNENGLKAQYATRLYSTYGNQALEKVTNNPYILCDERIGATFSEADCLAINEGISGDCEERLCAALLYELRYNENNGHVFLPREKLVNASSKLISVDEETLEECLDMLLDNGDIICEQIANANACYLTSLYRAEMDSFEALKQMNQYSLLPCKDISISIQTIEMEMGIKYAQKQLDTLKTASEYQLMVITGGPGTGKTTTVRAIIALYEKCGLKVLLAAPTGRAAKRMSELSGKTAVTIHRLLEAAYSDDLQETVFAKNEKEKLKCDALIIDESSMIDISLGAALLRALSPSCRVIFVGDADQLPSVGPGRFFSDIIKCEKIPVVRLTEIFRQKNESRIIRNAHLINEGNHPVLNENKGDFFFLKRSNENECASTVVQLFSERLPKNMGIAPEDIQVLSPMRKGISGVINLNILLQNALNPASQEKKEKKLGEIIFREGDRVMQTRNNYDIIWETQDSSEKGLGIYNGDMGIILSIDHSKETAAINFEGRKAEYPFELLNELEHAWAVTVHKSQGSEYKAVILSLCSPGKQLLYRSVLYTAVTRAKQILIIVGDDSKIHFMIDNAKQAGRYSGLRWRLINEVP